MSNISTQNVDDLLFKIFSQTLCPCPVYPFSRANIPPLLVREQTKLRAERQRRYENSKNKQKDLKNSLIRCKMGFQVYIIFAVSEACQTNAPGASILSVS